MRRQFYVIERTPCKTCQGMGWVNVATVPGRWESLTCGECDGRGKIEREVTLLEALREINKDA